MEIVLIALAAIVAVWVGRRVLARLRADDADAVDTFVHDPASALERERQRAMAVEAATRATGSDQPNTSL